MPMSLLDHLDIKFTEIDQRTFGLKGAFKMQVNLPKDMLYVRKQFQPLLKDPEWFVING